MTTTKSRDSSRWDISQLLASNLGGNILGFASGILIARFLGAEGRGSYQTATMFWAIVPGVLTLSAGTALVLQDGRPSRSWLTVASLVGTLMGSAVAWAAYLGGFLPLWVAVILSGTSLGYMTSDLCQGLLRQQKRYGSLANYRWIDVGGGAVLVVGFALAGALSVETAVMALCGSTMVAVFFAWARAGKGEIGPPTKFNWKFVPSIHGGTMLRVGSTWADQIAIACFLGLGPLGIYAIANSLATQFTILPSAMNTMLLRAAAESKERGLRLLQEFCQVIIWCGAVASMTFAFIAPPIVAGIFGPEFEESAAISALLVLGTMLAGLVLLFESFLIARGDARFTALARITAVPSLAGAIIIFALMPTLAIGAFIPVFANIIPLYFLWRRVQKDTEVSIYSFLKFPDIGRVFDLAKFNRKRM